jgi:NAD(P)-dependent dehydrogenase (short-subunit alcohol dehydrogenase family)
MRKQRSGRILNVSSVGGFSATPGRGVYCATKFAVEGLSEALHAEVGPLGIAVTVVEPGAFRTDFLDASSLHRTGASIADYDASAGRMRAWADDSNHAQVGDPAKAAAAIVSIAGAAVPPLRLQLGSDCVERVETKLAQVARELGAWRALALSTDHATKPGARRAGLPA